jgi:hypothetical protein
LVFMGSFLYQTNKTGHWGWFNARAG